MGVTRVMKRRSCVRILMLISISTMLSCNVAYANGTTQNASSKEVQDTQLQKTTKKDTEENRLFAGVAWVLEDAVHGEESMTVITGATEATDGEQTRLVTVEETKVEGTEQQKKYWGYTNLGIANVSNNLNIRETPSEKGKLVGKLTKDAACEILSVEDGWAHIKSGKVEGYCSTEFLFMGEDAIAKGHEVASMIAIVNTQTLKVREEPNTDCAVITLIPEGEELDVVEVMENGWVKFMLDDEEAYVCGDYVDIEERLKKATSLTELMYGQGVSDVRVELVQYAKQFLGNPYVWGGTSLTNGVDCSGFTMQVYKKFGISLPHYSVSQSKIGTKISLSEAKPGDLVFYAKNGTINHVAIYIGNGQVIHASNPKSGIKISSASYRTPAVVRRLLND